MSVASGYVVERAVVIAFVWILWPILLYQWALVIGARKAQPNSPKVAFRYIATVTLVLLTIIEIDPSGVWALRQPTALCLTDLSGNIGVVALAAYISGTSQALFTQAQAQKPRWLTPALMVPAFYTVFLFLIADIIRIATMRQPWPNDYAVLTWSFHVSLTVLDIVAIAVTARLSRVVDTFITSSGRAPDKDAASPGPSRNVTITGVNPVFIRVATQDVSPKYAITAPTTVQPPLSATSPSSATGQQSNGQLQVTVAPSPTPSPAAAVQPQRAAKEVTNNSRTVLKAGLRKLRLMLMAVQVPVLIMDLRNAQAHFFSDGMTRSVSTSTDPTTYSVFNSANLFVVMLVEVIYMWFIWLPHNQRDFKHGLAQMVRVKCLTRFIARDSRVMPMNSKGGGGGSAHGRSRGGSRVPATATAANRPQAPAP